MYFYDFEHRIATTLEQHIQLCYQQARFEPKKFNPSAWEQTFIETSKEWIPLMSYPEVEFDLWLSVFRSAYYSCLAEYNLKNLYIHQGELVEKFITHMVQKLQQIFISVNFLETIKSKNEMHQKQVNQYIEQYHKTTKHLTKLTTIKLYCAYQPEYVSNVSIFDVEKHLKKFERNLQDHSLFTQTCLFRYRRVLRLPDYNEYVVAYFFTFNADMVSVDATEAIFNLLQDDWFDSSEGYGRAINTGIKLPWLGEQDAVMEMFEEMEGADEDLEGLLHRDFVNVGADASHLRIRPKGFKQYSIKATKNFVF